MHSAAQSAGGNPSCQKPNGEGREVINVMTVTETNGPADLTSRTEERILRPLILRSGTYSNRFLPEF